jgi:hypothetical protein
MERILFPLSGYNIDANYNPNIDIKEFKWSKQTWDMHKLLKKSNDLKNKIDVYQDSIIETVYIENSGFEVVRKFKLKDGKWFLGFYGVQDL